MNILAIVIPHSGRHTGDYSEWYFPLGLAYVIASIRRHFPNANIVNADFCINKVFFREEIQQELFTIKSSFNPDFIIFGGLITRFSFINTLIELLRIIFPHAKLVLGGTAAGSGCKFFIDKVDYLVSGEGEEVIIDILKGDKTVGGNPVGSVDKKIIAGQKIKNLNTLPMPAYDHFMVPEYIRNKELFTGWRTMPVIASRGCPFNCNFCYSVAGREVRYRDEDAVIEEISYLIADYQIDSVIFWDDIQFLNKPWMEKFCRKVIKNKLRFKWSCSSRASLYKSTDIPLLKLAKQAGCLRISLGIESGNQKILNSMNKGITVKQIEDAIRIIRSAGIKATGSMLIGYPGENHDTIQDSIDFANRNLLNTSFCCLIPLPHTEIYDYCYCNKRITNEYEYLQNVSLAGGDASHIIINLTEMEEEVYKNEVRRANRLAGKIPLSCFLNYHGIPKGLGEYARLLFRSTRLKLTHKLFETP